MSMNLRRRVERLERIKGTSHAVPAFDSVVAILRAARRRPGSEAHGQPVQTAGSRTPEELRRRAWELRRWRDAQIRIEEALHPKRRF